MGTRSTEWIVLALAAVGLCLLSWYVKAEFEPVLDGQRMATSPLGMKPLGLLACLWWWSRGVATATRERVPTALSFTIALPLAIWFVIWI